MGTVTIVRREGSGRTRLYGWTAVSLCLGGTLAAAAAQPAAGAAVTTLAGSLSAVRASSAASAWAVGQTSPSTTGKTLILHWNGTSWAQVPSPSPGVSGNGLADVSAVSPSDAWAVGHDNSRSGGRSLLLHWNGARWSQVAAPVPGVSGLSGVSAVSARDVWAVGFSENSAFALRTLVLHWNGIRWTQVPSPSPGTQGATLNAVSAVSASDAWAVGRSSPATGIKTLVLHWNGTRWAQVPSPNPGVHSSELIGVSAISASDAWAVGDSDNSAAENFTLVLHWNGTSWTRVPSPSPGGPNGSLLGGVSALTGSDAWAAGSYKSAAGGAVTLLLHWNGTTWTRVPSPSPGLGANGSALGGVSAVSATDAWAAGDSFGASTGAQKTLLLRWNGTSWTQS